MQIDPSIRAPAPSSAETGTKNASPTLGKNEFLKLLMAQLGNQDPLNPMDNEAFVAQLAQFSSLEQLQTVNTQLETLLIATNTANQTNTATLVGKDVGFTSDVITSDGQNPSTFEMNLASDATVISVIVKDEFGKAVRTLNLPPSSAGLVEVKWDGRDDAGRLMNAGNYRVELAASDRDGKKVETQLRSEGRVTGVSFEKGYAELIVGKRHIKLSEITKVLEPTPNS